MLVSNRRISLLLLAVCAIVLAATGLLYLYRSDHCVLFYYGPSPGELPQGTAVAILNPLRNRKDEKNAEWLIRDLRTPKCAEIARERLRTDPVCLCQVMRGNTRASLIWLDHESDTIRGGTRTLIYDLPDQRARLLVYLPLTKMVGA